MHGDTHNDISDDEFSLMFNIPRFMLPNSQSLTRASLWNIRPVYTMSLMLGKKTC